MTLNASIRYDRNQLHVDHVAVADIIAHVGTPAYIYSLPRVLANLNVIEEAFSGLDAHVHFSAKANGNLHVLRTIVDAGAGVDCVSGGEIYKALQAGASGEDIVFAGVGKTTDEIRYALDNNVHWFNVENIGELDHINRIAGDLDRRSVRIALRLNPEVTANTHPYIATGHGGAKFGLTAESVAHILGHQDEWPYLSFEGLHLHVGSQLGDTAATTTGIELALELIRPHPKLRTINIGGGFPVSYDGSPQLSVSEFARVVSPLVSDYHIILEPGRRVIADAGILVTSLLYVKNHGGQTFYIVDASMTEIIRPMLYQAHHQIIPIRHDPQEVSQTVQIVGPVCETTDVLGRDIAAPVLQPGDQLAVLTTGAYGAVMASNYNARPRAVEVVVAGDGQNWHIARKRETYADLIRDELP